MKDDPARLVDDPAAQGGLRDDLQRASGASWIAFDTEAACQRFEAALLQQPRNADGTAGRVIQSAPRMGPRGFGWGMGGLGVLALVGIGLSVGYSSGSSKPGPATQPSASVAPLAESVSNRENGFDTWAGEQAKEATNATPPKTSEALIAPSTVPKASTSVLTIASSPVRESAREEYMNLARVRALLDSDPRASLELVEEGNRRFPKGVFGQEREVAAILALKRLGRGAEARARAERFLVGNPNSAHARRIRDELGIE